MFFFVGQGMVFTRWQHKVNFGSCSKSKVRNKMRGLDAKRIKSQNEKNELRSVLEWHPAANDVGEIFSSLKPKNSTLPAFESTVFLYLLG